MKKNLVIYVVDFHNGKFGFFEGNTLEQLSCTTMPKLECEYLSRHVYPKNEISLVMTEYSNIKSSRLRDGIKATNLLG